MIKKEDEQHDSFLDGTDTSRRGMVVARQIQTLNRPLIVLIGGGTGVGKSTIATQLAARLGIVRVVSTDAIREVMKSVVSQDFLPALYRSSFAASAQPATAAQLAASGPAAFGPAAGRGVLDGFLEQATVVAAGVRALLQRAIVEGTPMIIEGAHLVPGLIDCDVLANRAVLVQVGVVVDREEVHRSHLASRGRAARQRPTARYLAHFDSIRIIQRSIAEAARAHGVPIIDNEDLTASLARAVEIVGRGIAETLAAAEASALNDTRFWRPSTPNTVLAVHAAENRKLATVPDMMVLHSRRARPAQPKGASTP